MAPDPLDRDCGPAVGRPAAAGYGVYWARSTMYARVSSAAWVTCMATQITSAQPASMSTPRISRTIFPGFDVSMREVWLVLLK